VVVSGAFAVVLVAVAGAVAAAVRDVVVSGAFAVVLAAVAGAVVAAAVVADFAAVAFTAVEGLVTGLFAAVAGFASVAFGSEAVLTVEVFAAGVVSAARVDREDAVDGFSAEVVAGFTAAPRADEVVVDGAGVDFEAVGSTAAVFAAVAWAVAAVGLEPEVIFAGAGTLSTEFLSVVGLATTLLS
jgi:hypothetical protein